MLKKNTMVSSLKNICLKYTYNNMMFSIRENDLPNSLNSELNAMRDCCLSLDYITAVKNNHVQCLKKTHDVLIRIPWDAITMETAAEHGSIYCLKYLFENGCPINIDICDYTAKHGHLECLKYLHLRDMPITSKTCFYAASNGHEDCLQYLIKQGCEWSSLGFEGFIKNFPTIYNL